MDPQFEEYLKSRGISEQTIDILNSQKLDYEVISKMELEELRPFFETLGDRIAVREYCKKRVGGYANKKKGLIEKLQEKMFKKNKKTEKRKTKSDSTSEEEEPPVKKDYYSKSDHHSKSLKQTRKIEMGWLCSTNGDRHVQVRGNKGGGSRTVSVLKSSKKEDLLKIGKSLFFPEGKSSKGSQDKFNFDIWDYKHQPLLPDVTVQEVFSVTGFTRLRFYLSSTEITSTVSSVDTVEGLLDDSQEPSAEEHDVHAKYQENNLILEDFPSTNIMTYSEIVHNALTNVTDFEISRDNLFSDEIVTEAPIKLRLHRGRILDEMIDIFENLNHNCGHIQITVVSTNGCEEAAFDSGGVLRDCLSEFWESFYSRYTVGTDYKVPFVRHDMNFEKWTAVGRVLLMGWREVRYFPIQLSPPFMEYCIFGEVFSNLQESLFDFLSHNERKCLMDAIENFHNVDQDELLDVLGELECKTVVTEQNLKTLLAEIAHTHLIQKPMFVIESWSKILKYMITVDEMKNLYQNNEPNAKNIINKLINVETSTSRTVFGYLKKFIRESNNDRLRAFMRFCTGANMLTDNFITVNYNDCSSNRKPIAHTCGCQLELSTKYDNFPDFRTEMNTILDSNYWSMDLV